MTTTAIHAWANGEQKRRWAVENDGWNGFRSEEITDEKEFRSEGIMDERGNRGLDVGRVLREESEGV